MKTLPTNMPGGHYDFPWERRTMAKDPKPYSIEAMMDSITEDVNNEALDPEDVEQVVEAQAITEEVKKEEPKETIKAEPADQPEEKSKYDKALDGVFNAINTLVECTQELIDEANKSGEAAKTLAEIKKLLED